MVQLKTESAYSRKNRRARSPHSKCRKRFPRPGHQRRNHTAKDPGERSSYQQHAGIMRRRSANGPGVRGSGGAYPGYPSQQDPYREYRDGAGRRS